MPQSKSCRLLALLLICLLIFPCIQVSANALPNHEPPSVSAQSAILIEAESGNAVVEKNADLPLPMASTTKIMTALTALSIAKPETEICVTSEAVGVEGSSIYLTEGEVLTLEQLLWALLLESANDAAVAIAVGLCGSVEAFADEMNRVAIDMGLRQTHFTNPHGLDDPEHFTTARELAEITRHAMENDLFRLIISTRKASIPHAGTELTRLLINHNKLLRLYNGCIGVKTGYTKKSGRCLVSAAERDGVTMIAVTLNAPDDWNDHSRLLDYGFAAFESVTLCSEREFRIPLHLVGGTEGYVMLSNRDAIARTLPSGHGKIMQTVEAPRFAFASIAEGEVLGRVVWRCDCNGDGYAERIAETELVALYSVDRLRVRRTFWQWICDLFGF